MGGDDGVSNGDGDLSRDLLDHARKVMVLCHALFGPGSEPSQLAIVAVVGEEHFGTDQQDFRVEDDDPAVVLYVFVHHWPVGGELEEEEKLSWLVAGVSVVGDVQTSSKRCRNKIYLCIANMQPYIPISRSMPSASFELKICPRTSHECRYVSPS